ncbi:molybdenum cofactor biosynthesis protein 1 B [Neurospora crassa]|uniref:Molybdenum cofactor biosynthesis protein 1 B n=1 Tax=Neurospora crassa (strain ATCC 24698 / 74-OR23-1A / CBS 708.71 / DSM 1257 / FGSC 987) TaxID=367110 RepID=Q7RW32_NEUCR|nr:molybdenum cofactor biosynthesis protein 1 B [Neurospora crassa OR74A]EAA26553.2 molybdenum cofactor biosynthesis protein 1 B [Neurospora crassa OR74A]KHE79900.1 molybdenum cofactor biosynthesis protein 1 B [Neurospora crassa]|eukprot:XP_955789.2 molybdenum cofactor biosynthesis protein 1 B [Neurospora crassa OR74A]
MSAVARHAARGLRVRIGTWHLSRTSIPSSRHVATAAAATPTTTTTSSPASIVRNASSYLSSAQASVTPDEHSSSSVPVDVSAGASRHIPTTESEEPLRHPAAPTPTSSRRDMLKDAKPFSDFLTDNYNRQHDYLRISVTERCNLRCLYCMPEEGVPLSPQKELLTTPEIVLLSSLFVSQGVTKIRLTGGEPTVRRDIVPLMQQIGALRPHGLKELCLTTNGLSLHRKLDAMVEAGLTGINLSLDTMDPWQFQLMTRRNGFSAVQKSIDRIFELNRLGAGIKFKINCVVMRGLNDREVLPFVEMTRDKNVEVRFIEYMPFDGNKWNKGKMFSYQEMLELIRSKYPDLQRIQGHKNDTSKTFQVPGFAGKVGFITSMTHNFCGTCNRLRITSDGNIKVCLFGNAEVSLRDILRKINQGEPIDEEAFEVLRQAALEKAGQASTDGTSPLLAPNSEELLNVIGMAVKNKKEKHAGIGELENMKNRPMILIDTNTNAIFQHRSQSYQSLNHNKHQIHWNHNGVSSLLSPLTSNTLSRNVNSFAQRKIQGTSTFIPPPTPAPSQGHGHLRLFSTTRSFLSSSSSSSSDSNSNHNNEKGQPEQSTLDNGKEQPQLKPRLTHLTPTGEAHMVSITTKTPSSRTAVARCTVHFSNPTAYPLVVTNSLKKGDVLGVARIAGIMAAKRTPDIIPLCHPIQLTHAEVELVPVAPVAPAADSVAGSEDLERASESAKGQGYGYIDIRATVSCYGKTGVEMEAMTAASAAALTVYDMCKAVDKGMRVEGLRVVMKEGGKSGKWVEGDSVSEWARSPRRQDGE